MKQRHPDHHLASHRRKNRLWRNIKRAGPGDYIAWGGALALAAVAVWLPWDVYLHGANYSRPTLQFSRDGEVPADIVALREGRSPLFDMVAESYVGDPPPILPPQADGADRNPFDDPIVASDEANPSVPDGVDPITTASTPGDAANHVYKLINAGSGLALIADREGIYIVRPGAVLPDGRRVSAIVGSGSQTRIVASDETMVKFDR